MSKQKIDSFGSTVVVLCGKHSSSKRPMFAVGRDLYRNPQLFKIQRASDHGVIGPNECICNKILVPKAQVI